MQSEAERAKAQCSGGILQEGEATASPQTAPAAAPKGVDRRG